MEIERQYLAALDLTRQMLSAASAQDWETLTGLERQRAGMIAAIQPISTSLSSLDPALARRIAGVITEIEHENAAIVEQVQVWQKHARILLRLDKPALV
jgi:hypothetical protein